MLFSACTREALAFDTVLKTVLICNICFLSREHRSVHHTKAGIGPANYSSPSVANFRINPTSNNHHG